MEPTSVEAFCNLLGRSRLLPTDEVRSVRQRWLAEAPPGDAADVARFSRWLTARGHVTDYQAGMLLRGHADRFFLNEYKLLDRIGAGRMAGVYKALHRLGQVVAVKVLPPSKAKDAQLFGRFQREARMALKLKHPNVVRTFQTGEAHGLHYLVMEHLDGETLAEVLQRRGRLPPAEAVRVIHQALLGLQHLHDRDLVHRDLKPANLMLVPGRVAGRPDTTLQATVKILDIGLGRALFDEGDPAGGQIDLTVQGDILGDPDYMAPEQARDAHAADIRSDVYSLGCVLYHCLAGQPPFPDTNLVRKMIKHATEAPRPLEAFNPDVPDGLQQIVDWMLAKDPAQRYPTPDRAAGALQVFLAAGAEPPRSPEADPGMRPYLKWLEDSTDGGTSLPAARPAVAATVPQPAPGGTALPMAAPVRVAVAAPAPQVDVELVPEPLPGTAAKTPAKAGKVSRRDVILLVLGAGGVVLVGAAVATGIVLGRRWQRKPPVETSGGGTR
jgi:serine/threonine protein kinase